MIILIKMDMKYSHAIIRSFIAVIISANKKVLDFTSFSTPGVFSIMYFELVGSTHVRNNGSDHPSALRDTAVSYFLYQDTCPCLLKAPATIQHSLTVIQLE